MSFIYARTCTPLVGLFRLLAKYLSYFTLFFMNYFYTASVLYYKTILVYSHCRGVWS